MTQTAANVLRGRAWTFGRDVDTDLIIGCAFCVYWPIGRWKGL